MLELRWRIERYLRLTNMPPTLFGRQTVRDPRFVFDLRLGRQPRAEVSRRVHDWLDAQGAEGSRS